MVKRFVKALVVAVYRCLTHLIPVKKGLVVFDSFMGKSYSGSVRAVYEWMRDNKPDKPYVPVWVFTREALRKGLPGMPDCRIVTYGTISYYILMSRARVWVFDTRHEGYLVRKKSQRYIQTWHGTPLKKLGADIETFSMKAETGNDAAAREDAGKALAKYKSKVAAESAKWNVLLSASPFTTEVFRRCFSYDGEVLECGYPRNDVLFAGKERASGSPTGDTPKKTLLYAPTWRDDVHSGEGWWYGYTPSLDIEALEKALGNEWKLVVKLHYLVKCDKDAFPASCIKSGFLRVADSSEDIAGLFAEADALITDYSSVMFDYALLDRPMFFYTYDLERYRDELRGWYFDFEKEAPGPLSRDTESLINDIKDLSEGGPESLKWQEKRRAFKERFAGFEDGHASERTARKLETFL
ncbi:MAG: CDP-glycerol glycerophosphotransferase family protein [Lachnospiraceae bacterium]|nr:CDP-glycerol glycerophosphotransferase family protein [Lachnospiraceae bacterium]